MEKNKKRLIRLVIITIAALMFLLFFVQKVNGQNVERYYRQPDDRYVKASGDGTRQDSLGGFRLMQGANASQATYWPNGVVLIIPHMSLGQGPALYLNGDGQVADPDATSNPGYILKDGWEFKLGVKNNCNCQILVLMEWFGDDGKPFQVRIQPFGLSFTMKTTAGIWFMPPYAASEDTYTLHVPSDAPKSGWMRVEVATSPTFGSPPAVAAADVWGVMQNRADGYVTNQAVAGPHAPTTNFSISLKRDMAGSAFNYTDAGLAFANPNNAAASVSVTARGADDGKVVYTCGFSLPPMGHDARMMGDFCQNTPVRFDGTWEVSSDNPISALGIRAAVSARTVISTIPVGAGRQ